MQILLGGLNQYSRFIKDFAILASVMFELREAEFFKISQLNARVATNPKKAY